VQGRLLPARGPGLAWRLSLPGLGLLGLSVLALPLLVARDAVAQTSEISLPALRKDRGIRSGDFLLRPSLGISGHYDSNVFNGSEDEKNDTGYAPVSATSLRFSPNISLSNGTESDVQLNFGTSGDIRLYISDNEALAELTDFGGAANLDLVFAARRAISFAVFDSFARDLRANNFEITETLNRNNNSLGARVSFHPGDVPERRPFDLTFTGAWEVERYEDYDLMDADSFRTRLSSSWRFLPKTAAVLSASWDFRGYTTEAAQLGAKSGLTADSRPWRVQAGLAGALTKRLTFRLTGGWGMSLHDGTDGRAAEINSAYAGKIAPVEAGDLEFNSYLAGVSLGYKASEGTLLNIGYSRDFRDAFYGNYFAYHRGSFKLSQRFGTILDVSGWADLTYGEYGTYLPTGSASSVAVNIIPNRKDFQLDGGLTADFELARLLGMQVSYRTRGVFTSYKVLSEDKSKVLDVGSYVGHEILAGLTVRY
jgi:hypothetical protein